MERKSLAVLARATQIVKERWTTGHFATIGYTKDSKDIQGSFCAIGAVRQAAHEIYQVDNWKDIYGFIGEVVDVLSQKVPEQAMRDLMAAGLLQTKADPHTRIIAFNDLKATHADVEALFCAAVKEELDKRLEASDGNEQGSAEGVGEGSEVGGGQDEVD